MKFDRRHFLYLSGVGLLGTTAKAGLFENLFGHQAISDKLVYPGKAKSIIFITLNGGLSQHDTFEHKPELKKYHGKLIDVITEAGPKKQTILNSPFKFKQHGESGKWVSELFEYQSEVVDELCFLNGCVSPSANHSLSLSALNTGLAQNGFPSLGAWINHAIGTLNNNLPGHVVLLNSDKTLPLNGVMNWSSGGVLRDVYAGVEMNPTGSPMENISLPENVTAKEQHEQLQLLKKINQLSTPEYNQRTEIFEMALSMRSEIMKTLDISDVSDDIKKLYGLNDEKRRTFGSQLLKAKKLVENGVRFVQVYSGGLLNEDSWDTHDRWDDLKRICYETDLPIAGLIKDLKRSGMLEDTLVVCGGEFGRLPTLDSDTIMIGRDHNKFSATMWLAGAGIKKGISYGETDEIGYKTVADAVTFGDLHATMLHLLGINHKLLKVDHNGTKFGLTKGGADLIKKILI